MAENVIKPEDTKKRLSELVFKTSGTRKRYDSILQSIVNGKKTAYQGKFTHLTLSNLIARKLKPNEGVILSHNFYRHIFGHEPTEFDMSDLQSYLTVNGCALAPLYKKFGDNIAATAIFMIIHRKQYIAIEISDELREIITGVDRTTNPHSQFIAAALKVSEELGAMSTKTNKILKEDLYDALQLLSGNEVYLISFSFCEGYRIDPKMLSDYLSAKGFEISILKKEAETKETIESYKFYENLIGLAVSKTAEGIKFAHENLDVLFKVSEAADSGLPKAAIDTTGANIVSGTLSPI